MSGKLDTLLQAPPDQVDWDQVFRTFKRLRGMHHIHLYLCRIIPMPECPLETVDALLGFCSTTKTGPCLAQLVSLIWTDLLTGQKLHQRSHVPQQQQQQQQQQHSFLQQQQQQFTLLPAWKRIFQQSYQQYHDQYENYKSSLTGSISKTITIPIPTTLTVPDVEQVVQALDKTARIIRAMPRPMIAPLLQRGTRGVPPRAIKIWRQGGSGNVVQYTDDPTLPLLHFFTWNNVPPTVLYIAALVFPNHIQQRDAWGNLPIHYATLSASEWNVWWGGTNSPLMHQSQSQSPPYHEQWELEWDVVTFYPRLFPNREMPGASPQMDYSDLCLLAAAVDPVCQENSNDTEHDTTLVAEAEAAAARQDDSVLGSEDGGDVDVDVDSYNCNGGRGGHVMTAAALMTDATVATLVANTTMPMTTTTNTTSCRDRSYGLETLSKKRSTNHAGRTSTTAATTTTTTTPAEPFPLGASLAHALQHETAIPLLTLLYPRGASKTCTAGNRLPLQSYLLSLFDYRRQRWNDASGTTTTGSSSTTNNKSSTRPIIDPKVWDFVQYDVQRLLELCPQGILSVDPQLDCLPVAFPPMALSMRVLSTNTREQCRDKGDDDTFARSTTSSVSGTHPPLVQSPLTPAQLHQQQQLHLSFRDELYGFLPEDDEYQDDHEHHHHQQQQQQYHVQSDYDPQNLDVHGPVLPSSNRDPVFDLTITSLTYQLLRSCPRVLERSSTVPIHANANGEDEAAAAAAENTDEALWNLRERHLHRRWKTVVAKMEQIQKENSQLEATLNGIPRLTEELPVEQRNTRKVREREDEEEATVANEERKDLPRRTSASNTLVGTSESRSRKTKTCSKDSPPVLPCKPGRSKRNKPEEPSTASTVLLTPSSKRAKGGASAITAAAATTATTPKRKSRLAARPV